MAGHCDFGCSSLSALVWGLTLSKYLFDNFIIIFPIGIATWQTNFKFQTFAKPYRATVFTGPGWSQGMIAHIWSSDNFLVLDPASGIDTNGTLKSTRYNDFGNLRWLGNKKGSIDLFSNVNADKWYCVIGHAKLDTPGLSDGVFEFWIDDKLQAGSYHINWHGNRNADAKNYMINAVFFENYWNNGSPKLQERYFDNILISSKPIQCNCNE